MCPHSFLNSVQDQSGFVHGILRLVHIINCVYALLDVARGVGSFRLGIDRERTETGAGAVAIMDLVTTQVEGQKDELRKLFPIIR